MTVNLSIPSSTISISKDPVSSNNSSPIRDKVEELVPLHLAPLTPSSEKLPANLNINKIDEKFKKYQTLCRIMDISAGIFSTMVSLALYGAIAYATAPVSIPIIAVAVGVGLLTLPLMSFSNKRERSDAMGGALGVALVGGGVLAKYTWKTLTAAYTLRGLALAGMIGGGLVGGALISISAYAYVQKKRWDFKQQFRKDITEAVNEYISKKQIDQLAEFYKHTKAVDEKYASKNGYFFDSYHRILNATMLKQMQAAFQNSDKHEIIADIEAQLKTRDKR